ncbi:MAG: methyltransferase [Gemmatales bacterium]
MPAIERTPPALFALTVPGLEAVTAREIEDDLGGIVKKKMNGIVVFRVDHLDKNVLKLRTAEDVFLLAWGSDDLTYRASDLALIQKWTAKEPQWPRLLEYHKAIRPKPKGRPSFRLIAQMHGEHGYKRSDAFEALDKGLRGKIPAHLIPTAEDATLEIWLRIMGKRALCGVRLSDSKLRHRTYKTEHIQASLRPVVAAAMVRLGTQEGLTIDPCCGAGTLLAEMFDTNRQAEMIGGDIDKNALVAAGTNLRSWRERPPLVRWDARELPLGQGSIAKILCNPPFGRQLSNPEEIKGLYADMVAEWQRVLQPGGQAVILASDIEALQAAAFEQGWQQEGLYRIRLLGWPATISVWRSAIRRCRDLGGRGFRRASSSKK